MEAILVLVGIVILILFTKGSLRKTTTATPLKTEHQKPTGKVVEPFDAETAEKVTAKPVVEGAAYVIDGDSIVIKKTQIRLFGIDAPELEHPYGQKAKWALVKLTKGQKVKAEITEKDHFGRTVAHCSLPDGRDLSAEMVKIGLAIDWPKFSGGKYSKLEVTGIRKKLWLADARQKGRMHMWENFGVRKS